MMTVSGQLTMALLAMVLLALLALLVLPWPNFLD